MLTRMRSLPSLRLRGWEANPVLVKELRARFRGSQAFWMVSLVVTAVGAAALLVMAREGGASLRGVSSAPAVLGRQLFGAMTWLEFTVVLLLAPALGFGAISGERERQSLDLLLATPLSAASILWGKLAAAMAYVLLLVCGTLPALSLAFILGGVSWQDLLRSQGITFLGALSLTSLALLASTRAATTARAAILAYAAGGFLCVGTVGLGLLLDWIGMLDFELRTGALTLLNPFSMLVGSTAARSVLAAATQWLLALSALALAALSLRPDRPTRPTTLTVLAGLGLAWLLWFGAVATGSRWFGGFYLG